LAFITILFVVNIALIVIEETTVFKEDHVNPLRPLMYQLLFNHTLHFIFKRSFLDEDRKITKKHKWIWLVNLCSYSYIIYKYFYTDAAEKSESAFSRSWIPLDILLMTLVAIYYFVMKGLEHYQDIHEHHHNDPDFSP
jgi:hypothetical protein